MQPTKLLSEVEQEGFDIGNQGLSAVTHARYQSECMRSMWLTGWHRGHEAFKSRKLCLSCGARTDNSGSLPCGH
jgi:ribosome modulation factor